MSVTVRQVMKYLSEYPDDAKIGVMVADTEKQKKYQIKDGNWLYSLSYPVLVIDVGEARDMDEIEEKMACECEKPVVDTKDAYVTCYHCANCEAKNILVLPHKKETFPKYCSECGQRFNWEGVKVR